MTLKIDTTPRKPEERQRALELAELGMSTPGIAKHLGIPPTTVRRWVYQRANQAEAKQSYLDLRGRTSTDVRDPILRFALSGAWR